MIREDAGCGAQHPFEVMRAFAKECLEDVWKRLRGRQPKADIGILKDIISIDNF
jgi:hypothetical protein